VTQVTSAPNAWSDRTLPLYGAPDRGGIAPLSPQDLEQRERLRAWACFAAGLVCVWGCAWALNKARLLGLSP